MTETLVAQATTYDNAVQAIFRVVKDRPYVSSLDIEAIPVLAYALVLGNRKGLSLEDVRRVLVSGDEERLKLIEPAVESTDEGERLAALLFKRWLDEPILAERAHKNLVLVSAHALLFEQRSSL
jgi:hypothetical protein